MLALKDLKARVSDDVELLHEGEVFYLVLNGKKDNTFNAKKIAKISALLDKVNKSTGPAVLVTVSTNPKRFSTGFDLDYWAADPRNVVVSIAAMQKLLAKLLTLNVPTIAVTEGHVYAGGLIFAMCHDFRIGNIAGKGRWCLSEINIGRPLPIMYSEIIRETMPKQASRTLLMGPALSCKEVHELGVTSGVYSSEEEKQAAVAAFVKVYAEKANHRDTLQYIKKRLHESLIDRMAKECLTDVELGEMMPEAEDPKL